MPRPGVTVSLLDVPTGVSVPTNTGTWFAAGLTDKGALGAQLIQSLNDFVTVFGDRQTYSVLYDAVDLFFREGGNRVYISRVVGPTPTYGTRNLLDAGAAISLVVTANGPGAWSANYKVAVVAGTGGGTFKIQVTDAANVVLEDSGDLDDNNAAVLWANGSKYIRLALGASANDPAVVAPTALSAGTDDRGNITDTQWANALALFSSDLGPGQVSAPGRTGSAAWTQLTGHALNNNRVAILDSQNIATVATLQSDAEGINSRFAAMFAPWVVIPGLVTAAGSLRTAPPSGLIAGLIARNDPTVGTNRPSAGVYGASQFVSNLSQNSWTDTERASLNGSGVNVIRRFNGIRVYGWRSTADPVSDTNWLDFANVRLYMQLIAEFNQIGENFVFDEIDGLNGTTIGGFRAGLGGVCAQHYNQRELFGDTPEQAFFVDTTTPNTTATLAANELHAVVNVKMAPMAEWVQIQVVKRQLSEVLA